MEKKDEHKKSKSLNPDAAKHFSAKKKKLKNASVYIEGILKGDRVLLSQAITLIESTKESHQALAREIVSACLPYAGKSIRVGITGTPGVGKSTFIETLGEYLCEQDQSIAVLAVDPSSHLSGGSILGDKTRMERLAVHPKAFIRPSAAGKSLGGVAQKTRETIVLCEAAGFDTILIETVGVGQSEIAVHSMVDFFLLLLLPGAGDELQGIKRGIVEMADLVAVNKADGSNKDKAILARREYKRAVHLFPPKLSAWTATVLSCSALEGEGIEEIWQEVLRFKALTQENKYFQKNRQNQAKYWLSESIQDQLNTLFYQHPEVQEAIQEIEAAVLDGSLSSFEGARRLLALFQKD